MRKAIVVLNSQSHRADRLATRIAMSGADLDLLTSNSLSQATELIEQFNVRAIVTDLELADSHGMVTAMQLRQQSDVPVIICSDLVSDQTRREALELGFEDVFEQNSSDEVIERIHCLLSVEESELVAGAGQLQQNAAVARAIREA